MSRISHILDYNLRCDDCGVNGVEWQLNITPIPADEQTDTTALIPPGTTGNFCQDCYLVRHFRHNKSEPTLPIGTTSYGTRGKGKKMVVTYNRKSVGIGNCDFSRAIIEMYGDCGFEDLASTTNGYLDSYTLTWHAHLDHRVVNEKLNALRAHFPECTISYIKPKSRSTYPHSN